MRVSIRWIELHTGHTRRTTNALPGSNREIFGAKELHFTLQWVVRCLRKRPLNETLRKCCQKRLKASPDVSDCRLNKHRLINSLEG